MATGRSTRGRGRLSKATADTWPEIALLKVEAVATIVPAAYTSPPFCVPRETKHAAEERTHAQIKKGLHVDVRHLQL